MKPVPCPCCGELVEVPEEIANTPNYGGTLCDQCFSDLDERQDESLFY